MENNTQTQNRTFSGFEQKIGWATRVAYAGGDVACNIVFGMIGTLLTLFYSDYALVNMTAIGTIMLCSRVFDGFSDVVMGIIVEKTHSRFGKARPWLLWMSVPFCLSAVLMFIVDPSWGDVAKIAYVAITYNFCTTICYTAINLPYGTLSTLMTRSSHERDMLGNVRMGLSPLGKIISVVATLPLVQLLGNNWDDWWKVMSIWAGVALVLLIINFITCKETVAPKVDPEKVSSEKAASVKRELTELKAQLKKIDKNDKEAYNATLAKIEAKKKTLRGNKPPMTKALKFLITNQYFWAVLLLWMFQSVSFGVVGTSLPYFCKWIMKDENLYSTLFLVETLTLVGGVFVCMPLVKKVGKRNLALIGAIITLASQLIFIIKPDSVGMLYMISIMRSIGLAPLNAVVFGMLGDAVDFGHWKYGVRQEAFISAGGSVGTKLGSGLASFIITSLLDNVGYDGELKPEEGQWQTEPVNNMIRWIYIIGPIIIAAGVLLVLIFYRLDKKYDAMMLALTKREWEEEQKKKSVQRDIAAVEKKPVPIDPELAKMMAEMKPLEGKENPINKTKVTKDKKKK